MTDNLGRVTHLRYDAQGNTVGVKDALGNETDAAYTIGNLPLQTVLPATGQTGPGNPTSFKGSANAFNSDNQPTGSGYGYDGNGSPTRYKGSTLTFDPEQRLTGYGGSTQIDAYDGDGLRAWKQTAGGKTYFLYDASQPVCEYLSASVWTNTFGADGLVSRHSVGGTSSSPGGSSVATTFYTYDERGNVSQRQTTTTTTSGGPVGGPLGSSQKTSQSSGAGSPQPSGTTVTTSKSTVSEVYDAFGTRTAQGAQSEPWGYGAQAGYYTDAETGLVLCTHRFYDPSGGRWLTRDPMGYRGGVNLYGYCQNNPGNRADPAGYQGEVNQSGGGASGSGSSGPKFPVDGPIVPPVPRPTSPPVGPPADEEPEPPGGGGLNGNPAWLVYGYAFGEFMDRGFWPLLDWAWQGPDADQEAAGQKGGEICVLEYHQEEDPDPSNQPTPNFPVYVCHPVQGPPLGPPGSVFTSH